MPLSSTQAQELLSRHGFRKTPSRVELLVALSYEQFPLSIQAIAVRVPDMDSVTLYRALESLTEAGVLERSDFQHGHAHYELTYGRLHHHHLVCEGCGKISDIPAQVHERLNQDALAHAKDFKTITHHSLEFFGRCVSCA